LPGTNHKAVAGVTMQAIAAKWFSRVYRLGKGLANRKSGSSDFFSGGLGGRSDNEKN
jgi:hypothetical protein